MTYQLGPDDQARMLELDGIRLRVPDGWEARMRRAVAVEGTQSRPVTHAATVPLAHDRGDYGSGVVELLQADDVFVSLVEFAPEEANTALFPSVDALPRVIDPDRLRPNQLQRHIPGQAGTQIFFTFRGRPFCLYVVVGSAARRAVLAQSVNQLLSNLEVS